MKNISLMDGVNLTLVSAAVGSVIWMFNTFAKAEDLEKMKADTDAKIISFEVREAIGQYWDRLDDRDEAEDEGDEDLAQEYEHEMEELLTFICEHRPTFRRCSA